MLLRLLALARASVEFAQAEVAVGDKGAHAEFASERQRVLVPRLGLAVVWGIGARGDLGDEPEGPCFVSPLLVLARKRQRATSMRQRLLHSAREQTRLAEVSQPQRVARHDAGPGAHGHGGLEQRDAE